MKKIINTIVLFFILFVAIFSINVYAATDLTINTSVSKSTVNPGDTTKVTVEFAASLGSYTVDIAYDNNLLEYVSSEGGTANDNGTRVRVYYFDSTGGSSPRTNMSVTFKAKQGILTSNPTNFSITAEGLANPDASVTYNDITTPIVKDIVVEPKYEDYKMNLKYTGEIIKNEKKDMEISIASSMGKNYEHTRLLGEVTGPTGATAKLLATDNSNLEHDIIQNGWGSAAGDAIGGKDVAKVLNVQGLFDKSGSYSIKLRLVDRDNSDAEIASKTFQINVKDQATGNTNNETNETQKPNENTTNNETNKKPTTLPKTGNMIYFAILPIIAILTIAYIVIKKKN